jgi:hypothetical protein
MQIACTQPLRTIEGIRDPDERRATLDLVAKRFLFMRAFDTDLVFMCSNIRTDSGVTSDLQTVARDLCRARQHGGLFLAPRRRSDAEDRVRRFILGGPQHMVLELGSRACSK